MLNFRSALTIAGVLFTLIPNAHASRIYDPFVGPLKKPVLALRLFETHPNSSIVLTAKKMRQFRSEGMLQTRLLWEKMYVPEFSSRNKAVVFISLVGDLESDYNMRIVRSLVKALEPRKDQIAVESIENYKKFLSAENAISPISYSNYDINSSFESSFPKSRSLRYAGLDAARAARDDLVCGSSYTLAILMTRQQLHRIATEGSGLPKILKELAPPFNMVFMGLDDNSAKSLGVVNLKCVAQGLETILTPSVIVCKDGYTEAFTSYNLSRHAKPGTDLFLSSMVKNAFSNKKLKSELPVITDHFSQEGEIDAYGNVLPVNTYRYSTTKNSLIIPEIVMGKEMFAVKTRISSGSLTVEYFERPAHTKKD